LSRPTTAAGIPSTAPKVSAHSCRFEQVRLPPTGPLDVNLDSNSSPIKDNRRSTFPKLILHLAAVQAEKRISSFFEVRDEDCVGHSLVSGCAPESAVDSIPAPRQSHVLHHTASAGPSASEATPERAAIEIRFHSVGCAFGMVLCAAKAAAGLPNPECVAPFLADHALSAVQARNLRLISCSTTSAARPRDIRPGSAEAHSDIR
jgi:hypothetical protein